MPSLYEGLPMFSDDANDLAITACAMPKSDVHRGMLADEIEGTVPDVAQVLRSGAGYELCETVHALCNAAGTTPDALAFVYVLRIYMPIVAAHKNSELKKQSERHSRLRRMVAASAVLSAEMAKSSHTKGGPCPQCTKDGPTWGCVMCDGTGLLK